MGMARVWRACSPATRGVHCTSWWVGGTFRSDTIWTVRTHPCLHAAHLCECGLLPAAEFLRGLGFGSIQRSLIAKAGQETEILQSEAGDAVTIVTSDLRGSTSLELPVNGPSIAADDGDGGARVLRAAKVERGAVVVTETLQGEREPLSVCKRKLGPDGRMVVDVRKRTPEGKSFVEMQVIAARRNDA